MMDNSEVRGFALGPGKIFAAEGKIAEDVLESKKYLVGEARDTCTLRYEYKTKELYDTDGNVAATLRFGEKVRVSGNLDRMIPDALPVILGKAGGKGALSVLLVCPLPGGEAFRLYLNGGVGSSAGFEVKEGGRVKFDLLFGGEVSMPKFCLMNGGAAS